MWYTTARLACLAGLASQVVGKGEMMQYWQTGWDGNVALADGQDGAWITDTTILNLFGIDIREFTIEPKEGGGFTTTGTGFTKWLSWSGTPITWGVGAPVGTALKQKYPTLKKVIACLGGWGLEIPMRGYAMEAADAEKANPPRNSLIATKLLEFVKVQEVDGVEIDWEYPVTNGAYFQDDTSADYHYPAAWKKQNFVEDKANYPLMLKNIRRVFDADKKGYSLSVCVPAKPEDYSAWLDKDTVNAIQPSIDFWSLMTYDKLNRRDPSNFNTKSGAKGSHAGKTVINDLVTNLAAIGVDYTKMMLGWALYAKFFPLCLAGKLGAVDCRSAPYPGYNASQPYGGADGVPPTIKFAQMENPTNNIEIKDPSTNNTNSGALAFNYDQTSNAYHVDPSVIAELKAIGPNTKADKENGAHWAITAERFWSWTNAQDIADGCQDIYSKLPDATKEYYGMFAFSAHQDLVDGSAIKGLAACVKKRRST